MANIKTGERVDDLQFKNLKIIQNPSGFCFGVDAVLLSDFAKAKKSDSIVDLGTGTGIIPILMYGRYEPRKIVGVEIQNTVSDMAERSVEINNLSDKIEIYKGDIKDCFNFIGAGGYDVVVSNPPYKKNSTGLKNPDKIKAISRHEILINLDELVFSASKLLKQGGKFYMIHRPERIRDIILCLDKNRFMPKRMRFVHSHVNDAPSMILIEAAKDGGDFLKVEKPLYIYNDDGSYTDEINGIYHRNDN